VAPVIELPAHSAPLGLVFVKSDKFPSDWQGDLLVAYHGSWNRSEPTGYKIARFKKGTNGKYEYVGDLVSGWLSDGKVSGRPVDLKFGPDGALYVSDDYAGVVYRIEYQK
jgi:glucose/arabinose dehydrogenase